MIVIVKKKLARRPYITYLIRYIHIDHPVIKQQDV